MRAGTGLRICPSCRAILSRSVSTKAKAARPRTISPHSTAVYDVSFKSNRKGKTQLSPHSVQETNGLHDSFQDGAVDGETTTARPPLRHPALQAAAPLLADYLNNHSRRHLQDDRRKVLVSLPTHKTRLKEPATLTHELKQNVNIANQLKTLPAPTPLLGDIPIPPKPTAIIPDLESRQKYSPYNFQRRLFAVMPDEADQSDGPFYQERTILSAPTKFSPIVPPRSTKQIQRLLHSQIRPQDPYMGHPMRDPNTLDHDIISARTELLQKLSQLLSTNVQPTCHDLDSLMEMYTRLPSPRVCFLRRDQVRELIKVIARAHNYHWLVYEFYFHVIRDMQENGTVIRLTEWAGLIDAAGKGQYFTKEERVQRASEFVSEMNKARIRPNEVVYASLFQAAARAKDWNMVQILESEVRRLGYQDHLLLWTERFRIAGLLGNLSQLHNLFRKASQNRVPVDIFFMNTVLAAFLTVDCPQVAELVYDRLRNHALAKFGPTTLIHHRPRLSSRRDRRVFLQSLSEIEELERIVKRELHARRITDKDLYEKDGTPTQLHGAFSSWAGSYLTPSSVRLVPNHETIRVFISYHCHKTGRLEDVAYYLNELDIFKGKVNYGVYVSLLHGFFLWHQVREGWDEPRLRRVYDSLRTGIQSRTRERQMPVTYIVCLTAIRAFGRVCGAAAAREVWEYLKPFLEMNDNVSYREDAARGWLEDLVVAFEGGKGLNADMRGRDIKYRVGNFSTAMPG
jgi:hypothetical protein